MKTQITNSETPKKLIIKINNAIEYKPTTKCPSVLQYIVQLQ